VAIIIQFILLFAAFFKPDRKKRRSQTGEARKYRREAAMQSEKATLECTCRDAAAYQLARSPLRDK
jgi:hypothetical protein